MMSLSWLLFQYNPSDFSSAYVDAEGSTRVPVFGCPGATWWWYVYVKGRYINKDVCVLFFVCGGS